ncbi:MAG: type 1 glutamine amidotransferase [Methanomicrobiaceae archaeon]|nr:type 1 glutamine amidotransferase [Methanomicrobiaceae archaeon]
MKTIAVLLTNLFEDSEFIYPTDAFRRIGHRIVPVGVIQGEMVWGKTDHTPVKIERAVTDISVDDFDALLIPGGYSPDKLRIHEHIVDFVRAFVESGKPVFIICHAPQLLITAKVLKGRRITGYASIIQDIKNAGATFVDAEVVEDGNLVSSRDPRDLAAFTEAALRRLD